VGNIVVPQLGESVVEARVARWLKKQGDRVEAGDALVELETEKVDIEVRAERAGVISRIEQPEGTDVKVGAVLAVVDEAGAAGSPPVPAAKEPSSEPPRAAPAVESGPPAGPAKAPARAATPAAAAPEAVDPIPSEPDDAATPVTPPPAAPSASPAPKAPAPAVKAAAPPAASGRIEERMRMSKRRQTIARRLLEAQRTAAMLTTFNEIDMTSVMDLRARAKDQFKQRHGVSLGIVAFFVNASIAALKAYPQLNAEIQDDEIVLKRYYDIGVAVASEGGLVVPVLRDADRMSFAEIEKGIRTFATRAADSTLTLEDLRGGTFTITNGGVFGSLLSTPILNLPQVGILGLHQIQDRAVAVNGKVVIRPMMFVALTYDHRLVDGREAVQFLVTIKECVEDPGRLLLVR
jgi:2-oxoglutarate dehydrogenase E2 component (dihydrolipoamide succinyltransferase)